MRNYGDEKVLVVPTSFIPHREGVLRRNVHNILEKIAENAVFMLRNQVEGNPAQKQIIPYCTFIHIDDTGTKRIFYAQRSATADRELGGKWTIGLGGHINPEDQFPRQISKYLIQFKNLSLNDQFWRIVLAGAERELDEELQFSWEKVLEIKFGGLVFTAKDLVSKDHLGIWLLLKMADREVKIKKELVRGGFFTDFEFVIFSEWHDFLLSIHTPEQRKAFGFK